MTNIVRKAHDLLPPRYRKAIFVEDTTFQLDGPNRVAIDASVHTSPNDLGLSPATRGVGMLERPGTLNKQSLPPRKYRDGRRGADAYRNRGQSAAEDKRSSPEAAIQNAIGLSSKGWDYYLSLAWYHLFDQNPREAIAASLKALELSPR